MLTELILTYQGLKGPCCANGSFLGFWPVLVICQVGFLLSERQLPKSGLSQLTEGGKALIHNPHSETCTAEGLMTAARGDQGPDAVVAAASRLEAGGDTKAGAVGG